MRLCRHPSCHAAQLARNWLCDAGICTALAEVVSDAKCPDASGRFGGCGQRQTMGALERLWKADTVDRWLSGGDSLRATQHNGLWKAWSNAQYSILIFRGQACLLRPCILMSVFEIKAHVNSGKGNLYSIVEIWTRNSSKCTLSN